MTRRVIEKRCPEKVCVDCLVHNWAKLPCVFVLWAECLILIAATDTILILGINAFCITFLLPFS